MTEVSSAQPPAAFSFRTAALTLNRESSAADGEPSPDRTLRAILHYAYVEPNYFETLGIPLLAGRSFQTQAGQPEQSVILSESAANQLWPGQNPIGRSVRLGPIDERFHKWEELVADGPAFQVIGVAQDTRGVEFDESDSKKIYLPLPENSLVGWAAPFSSARRRPTRRRSHERSTRSSQRLIPTCWQPI